MGPTTAGRPFISFLSDFGSDNAVAVCRAIIWGIAPEALICDLTHVVRKFAVRDGAFLLDCAVPYLPVGIHLGVVDPGVGTERRPIAIRVERGDLLVGPDNGLLLPAATRLGGVAEARVLENQALWREPVSSTFHGRDIFAPVVGHLAAGSPLATVGSALSPQSLANVSLPRAVVGEGVLSSAVLFIDSFGNCRLAGEVRDLEAAVGGLAPGRRFRIRLADRELAAATWATTFADVPAGEPLLYDDADYAGLALAVNRASAAEAFGLALDDAVEIAPA